MSPTLPLSAISNHDRSGSIHFEENPDHPPPLRASPTFGPSRPSRPPCLSLRQLPFLSPSWFPPQSLSSLHLVPSSFLFHPSFPSLLPSLPGPAGFCAAAVPPAPCVWAQTLILKSPSRDPQRSSAHRRASVRYSARATDHRDPRATLKHHRPCRWTSK